LRRVTKKDPVLYHSADTARNAAVKDAKIALHPSDAPDDSKSDAALRLILASLDDDKAEDVVSINLRGKSEMADYMVIASGRSSRQVASMAEKLTERLKLDLGVSARSEGKAAGDWVLIDTGDVVVHIFRPELREFYQLEKMWISPGDAVTAKA
jgi:ribosome-associated protein